MYQQQFAEISARYRRFAEEEARGRSPLYEQLANGVADDQEVLAFLATLPKDKQQPNLLLGAVRHLFGLLGSWNEFRRRITANFDDVRTLMLARSTQTNEPARCATLLPILAQLPQPLALIEVGASAGLNLLPDFYSYDFGGVVLRATAPTVEAPLFSCKVNEATPLPAAMPKIVWRAGLDLNPLEVSDPEQAVWLERLVWPEQRHRLANLRAAIKVAKSVRPNVIKGDLRNDLGRLADAAPKEATLVVFHTAVLSYVVAQADRDAFARHVQSLCPYWIANESPRVFPEIAALAGPSSKRGHFLVSVNGFPVAWADPHGASLEWIENAA